MYVLEFLLPLAGAGRCYLISTTRSSSGERPRPNVKPMRCAKVLIQGRVGRPTSSRPGVLYLKQHNSFTGTGEHSLGSLSYLDVGFPIAKQPLHFLTVLHKADKRCTEINLPR